MWGWRSDARLNKDTPVQLRRDGGTQGHRGLIEPSDGATESGHQMGRKTRRSARRSSGGRFAAATLGGLHSLW